MTDIETAIIEYLAEENRYAYDEGYVLQDYHGTNAVTTLPYLVEQIDADDDEVKAAIADSDRVFAVRRENEISRQKSERIVCVYLDITGLTTEIGGVEIPLSDMLEAEMSNLDLTDAGGVNTGG